MQESKAAPCATKSDDVPHACWVRAAVREKLARFGDDEDRGRWRRGPTPMAEAVLGSHARRGRCLAPDDERQRDCSPSASYGRRTMICCDGPSVPSKFRSRAVNRVSPTGTLWPDPK